MLLTILKIVINKPLLHTMDPKMTSLRDHISIGRLLSNKIITNINRTTYRKERKLRLAIMLGHRSSKTFSKILILSNQDFLLLRTLTKEKIKIIGLIQNNKLSRNRMLNPNKLRNLIIWHINLHQHQLNLNKYSWEIKILFKTPKRRIMSSINFKMNH